MQNLRYSHYFRLLVTLADMALLGGMLLYFNQKNNYSTEPWLSVVLLLLFFWFILSAKSGIYAVSRLLTYTKYLERLAMHLLMFAFGIFLLSRVLNDASFTFAAPRFIAVLSAVIILYKSLIFFGLKWYRKLGYNHRNVMFWQADESSMLLRRTLEHRRDYGYKIFDFEGEKNIPSLKEFWRVNGIHTMYIPMKVFSSELFNSELKEAAESSRVRISVIPDALSDEFTSYRLAYAETQPLLEKAHFPLEAASNFILKRALDILLSAAFLVFIASWLFPIIAVLIKYDSKGSVFFKQRRYGLHNSVFVCYKFRTMVENTEQDTATTKKGDTRITRVGIWLRHTSMDELPQFINVLMGSMSIVGPRPHMISVDDHYRNFINRYSIRNTVRPGITGLAQINGLRGDTGDMQEEMQRRVLSDAFYVKNWSLSLDFVIMMKTAILLLKGDKKAF